MQRATTYSPTARKSAVPILKASVEASACGSSGILLAMVCAQAMVPSVLFRQRLEPPGVLHFWRDRANIEQVPLKTVPDPEQP